MKEAVVVGCGLSGAVVARELAEAGFKVTVYERRPHIGGNMYDYVDEHGVLVHKYGPHTFHTTKRALYEYICKWGGWIEYKLTCGAEINGKCTPTPFNFQTIDDFYSVEAAKELKTKIRKEFPNRETATVLEVLQCNDPIVRAYGQFLFDNDYSLYTAKQWGVPPSEIDPSVLRRVPLRFNYKTGYFDDEFQVMPETSYAEFFENLLNHTNIAVKLNTDARDLVKLVGNGVQIKGHTAMPMVVYTGEIDALFDYVYGKLPYRSLRFEWAYENIESKQDMPVVAYPQAEGYTRIVEFKKLPMQDAIGTTYEVEYSLPYRPGEANEPYYPVLTEDSQRLYQCYLKESQLYNNLYCCGRLAEFKYYNMDQVLERALTISSEIIAAENR